MPTIGCGWVSRTAASAIWKRTRARSNDWKIRSSRNCATPPCGHWRKRRTAISGSAPPSRASIVTGPTVACSTFLPRPAMPAACRPTISLVWKLRPTAACGSAPGAGLCTGMVDAWSACRFRARPSRSTECTRSPTARCYGLPISTATPSGSIPSGGPQPAPGKAVRTPRRSVASCSVIGSGAIGWIPPPAWV